MNDNTIYIQKKLIDMFERIKALNDDILNEFEQKLGNNSKLDNIDMTLKGKLLLVAKKLFFNSAVTFLTGIDPMYLDKGLDNFFSKEKKYNNYLKSNPILLSYSILKSLDKGLDKTLDVLKNGPDDKIKKFVDKYIDFYEKEVKTYVIQENNPCYSPQIIYFMWKYFNTMSENDYYKVCALAEKKYNLELNVNIAKETKELFESLNKENTIKIK